MSYTEFVAHAGASFEVAALDLAVLLISLALIIVGIKVVRGKTKQGLENHRRIMTVAFFLANLGIIFVMWPAFGNFYTDPDVMLLSSLSLTTLFHASVGIFAEILALSFVLGFLPKQTRKWMRVGVIVWILVLAVGIIIFLQMLALI